MILKKITAIFFLLLFAFNWFGYRLAYDYVQQKNNQKLEVLLDNDSYSEEHFVELKIPVQHLAYQNSQAAYERYNGEVELNGTLYKYVKRKLAGDTLYLVCIINSKKMRLETAKNDFFKISNDLPQSNNSKSSDHTLSVFKNFQPVFNDCSFGAHISVLILSQQNNWLPEATAPLLFAAHLSPEQPPDAIAA